MTDQDEVREWYNDYYHQIGHQPLYKLLPSNKRARFRKSTSAALERVDYRHTWIVNFIEALELSNDPLDRMINDGFSFRSWTSFTAGRNVFFAFRFNDDAFHFKLMMSA